MKETNQINTYYKFSDYLKNEYGRRLWKISVDAGFTCPNLDGTLSREGCIYCNNRAFGQSENVRSLPEQIEAGLSFAQKRYKAKDFILYFQSFTNTYGKPEDLKTGYDIIRDYPEFRVLAVGTRPDCLDREKCALLESYTDDVDVWVELGLQSIHDKTLLLINRGHTYRSFQEAVELLSQFKIKIFVHVILGLPGESQEHMIDTAKTLSSLPIEGVKIHPLHVVRGTGLEELFKNGNYTSLKIEDYVENAISFLEYLRPDITIARITADVKDDLLIAPEWIRGKNELLDMFDSLMIQNNRRQGNFLDY